MYVALWYKNGKPIHGYAWNDGGVVQASFPYNTAELTGKENLGGMIQVSLFVAQCLIRILRQIILLLLLYQVLQYSGDHNTLGYWYEWICYKDRFDKTDVRQLVRCGQSLPILWADRAGGSLLGYLDMKTEEAYFSKDGKAERVLGKPLSDMKIIVRLVYFSSNAAFFSSTNHSNHFYHFSLQKHQRRTTGMHLRQVSESAAGEADHAQRMDGHTNGRPMACIQAHQSCG